MRAAAVNFNSPETRRVIPHPPALPVPRPAHLRLVNSVLDVIAPPLIRSAITQGITIFAQRAWLSIATMRISTPSSHGIGGVGGAAGAGGAGLPPGGGPILHPPKRPTDGGPQMAFPRRSPFFRSVPLFATLGLLAYVAIRVLSLTTLPPISIVAGILLFWAEMHCISNGIQYQGDIRNEGRHNNWKKRNWPDEARINHTLGPEGPHVAMEIASAAEEPTTCWPTIYATIEMEGNKKVIWNTQANVLWLSLKKPDKNNEEGYRRLFLEFQTTDLSVLEQKYTLYSATWQNIQRQLAAAPGLDLNGLSNLHKDINQQLQNVAYQEKQRLTESVNSEYSTVWSWIKQRVQTVAAGRAVRVNDSNWNIPEAAEQRERIDSLGSWQALSRDEKIQVISNIYRMLGRRHITRGGLWVWWGSKSQGIPQDPEFKRLLHKVFFGSLRTSGEVEEVGLGQEVDITPYGFVDGAGNFCSFSDNLPQLVEKVKEYIGNPGATAQERQLYAFDYMRSLIDMDKREQLAGGQLEYFPRNVRSGGEDIKTGLEYETLAEECAFWQEADLDFQFQRMVNTYVNHHLTWWDRDRFADMDHGGRKSNSINALVHHLAGKWHKVIKSGDDAQAKNTSGFIVAADNSSALMRVFLERLENGQYVWDMLIRNPAFRHRLNALTTRDEVVDFVERELAGVEQRDGLKAKRWVFVNDFLTRLSAAGPLTRLTFRRFLQNEGMLPASLSPRLIKEISRTVDWLRRENSVEGRRRILHLFFDQAGPYLDLRPRGNSLRMMVDLAFQDREIPPGYSICETYDFNSIEYFTNIDAEVRPRWDYMARTIPFLDKLIKDGEIPPTPTLMDRLLFWRKRGGTIKPGFLQCPQFYTIDPEEGEPIHFTAHVDQRLFYQTIQPSKSLNDGSFSCGSNVTYHLSAKRETSHRLFTEPETERARISKPAVNTQQLGRGGIDPGGWSYTFTASEIYVEDKNKAPRPVIAYQPAETPTEDHAATIHFLDYEEGKKPERRAGRFLNDVIGKGESPKNAKQLSEAQHPKWAGGTIGDFFNTIVPRYMRWLPGASFVARQMLKVINAVPAPVRSLAKSAIKVVDSIMFRLPVARHLWRFCKILGRYANHLTWETSMSHKPKMNPFSKVGMEFFRSGTWYFRGLRDLILIGAPVMLTTSILGSALAGYIFTGLVTPILLNPGLLLPFFGAYLLTTLWAYLHSTKRLGQKIKDVMFKKEAVLLGMGWPGYVHADFWGLMGPSGRLGATTKKGVGGWEPLGYKYALPAFLAGVGSLAGTVIGAGLFGSTVYSLGWSIALGGPGVGILTCTIWALYHTFMIFRGFQISQGLGRSLKHIWDETLNRLYGPKKFKGFLSNHLDNKLNGLIPAPIKNDTRGWNRLNPLIISGKLFFGLVGAFGRPEKW